MKSYGIILAGGVGSRMGAPIPKQYLQVCGRELIEFSISAFKKSSLIDDFVVIIDSEEHIDYLNKKYGVNVILGGKTRNESFKKGLDYIRMKGGCEFIFVNEAARPMITSELIDEFLTLVQEYSCVYCTRDITDSLETIDGSYTDRTKYRLVMSPEAYKFRDICDYFDKDSDMTFPGHLLPSTLPKCPYTGYADNIKATYPEDLIKIESLIRNRASKFT